MCESSSLAVVALWPLGRMGRAGWQGCQGQQNTLYSKCGQTKTSNHADVCFAESDEIHRKKITNGAYGAGAPWVLGYSLALCPGFCPVQVTVTNFGQVLMRNFSENLRGKMAYTRSDHVIHKNCLTYHKNNALPLFSASPQLLLRALVQHHFKVEELEQE